MQTDSTGQAKRHSDMDPKSFMRLVQQEDGDMCVLIFDAERQVSAGVEFCTLMGGGKSPNTRYAVQQLMLAMQRDEQGLPLQLDKESQDLEDRYRNLVRDLSSE